MTGKKDGTCSRMIGEGGAKLSPLKLHEKNIHISLSRFYTEKHQTKGHKASLALFTFLPGLIVGEVPVITLENT